MNTPRGPDPTSISQRELTAALRPLRAPGLYEAAIRAHVMYPENVAGVHSGRGRGDSLATPLEARLPPGGLRPPERWGLDVEAFADAIDAGLRNRSAGYTLRVNASGGSLAARDWSFAKTPQDGGEDWTTGIRMHVASLSKIVTAIAMTKLLENEGIAPGAQIAEHLPGYWVKGPDVGQITFAELLTHRSGLAFGDTSSRSDYEFMRSQVAAGTTHLGNYSYQNMNFGLCRILLATINGTIPVDFVLPSLFSSLNDLVWDLVCVRAYEQYVVDELFAPAGISGPALTHNSADALAYDFPVSRSGWNSGDLSSMAGGAGWHMSVDDLLKLMSVFRRAGAIVSSAAAQAMLDATFGIDWAEPSVLGTYYATNGNWYNDSGQEEQGVAFFLPEEIEVVVLVNSPVLAGTDPSLPSSKTYLYSLVAAAFTNSFVILPPIAEL